MNKFPIGLQLYSVRDDLAADFEGTLKAVAEMGYDGVEFAGLCGKSAEEAKALCEKYGLVPVSAHIPFT
ncbi:MAG: sugar phosphate isomerase/epimerase, partial [Clostridia bacterium]|nr:sugar phosphate isomerase/epimerase [Clostridia bacterium]